MRMKKRMHARTKKCSDRAVWMLKTVLILLKRVESAGDIPKPVISASGAATKTVMKYAICWRLLYAVQPLSVGQCNERYWIRTDRAFGNTAQLVGTRLSQRPL